MHSKHIATAVALALAFGCAPALAPSDAGATDAGSNPNDAGIPPASGAFRHSVEGGVVTTIVDATSMDVWQHLDLDTGLSTDESDAWDLAFSRFRIRTNGGASGPGGVQVAALPGQSFDTLTMAPEEGWTVDIPDGDADDDTEPDNVFNNGTDDWYAYDPETHALTPKDVTYAIASTVGRFYKLRIDGYYDDAGSPGVLRFRWAAIAPPASALPDAGVDPLDGGVAPDAGEEPLPPGAIVVDASDPTAWVYLDAETGLVTPTDPSTGLGWDLALRRTEIRTNSGTSGAGVGGAREYDGALAFDDITDATTFGYAADELLTSGRPGAEPVSMSPVLAGWYDYDPATHRVSPGDRTYLVRTATGGYAKLRVWRWRDGEYALSFTPVARRVDVVELDVDASASDAWAYLSLRDGALVAVSDPATDGAWDLGISRTRMRTNGGTSGAGMGEAAETAATEITDLGEAPAEGWMSDAMLTDGPPGSPSYSGNPVLATWYDYDFTTHTVTPRPVVFMVRTADGHLGALRVRSYAGGMFRAAIAFAGAGQDRF